ncbi:MAG: phosphotransferase [Candidatus Limnocylindrales bacterium]
MADAGRARRGDELPDDDLADDGLPGTLPRSILDALAGSRWAGLRGVRLESGTAVDTFRFEDGGVLALVEAVLPDSSTVRLTLPADDPVLLGDRAAGTVGAGPWAGLDDLARRGGTVAGARGFRLLGRPGRMASLGCIARPGGDDRNPGGDDVLASDAGVRRSSADQSHTGVILDGARYLKLYRRLGPGGTHEAGVLAALDSLGGAATGLVPGWIGAVELTAPGAPSIAGATTPTPTATIAILQAAIPDATDAFESLAEALAAWLAADEPLDAGSPGASLPAAIGRATGQLHRALAAVPGTPTPRPASDQERTAWLAAALARIDTAITALAVNDPAASRRLELAAPVLRRALRPLGDAAIAVNVGRIHGDLHLGQVLVSGGQVVVIDFEGDPMAGDAPTGPAAPALRDVATVRRSIDHVARSGLRRAANRRGREATPAATTAAEAWIRDARSTYLSAVRAGAGSGWDRWPPDRSILRAMEIDAEIRELIYAARFLPAWSYAPIAALRALTGIDLGAKVDGSSPPPAPTSSAIRQRGS